MIRAAVKCGYPPRTLTLIPELPVSSLGIEKGDQIMVNESKQSTPHTNPAPATAISPLQPRRSVPIVDEIYGSPNVNDGAPDSVTVSGGSLVHRVSLSANPQIEY